MACLGTPREGIRQGAVRWRRGRAGCFDGSVAGWAAAGPDTGMCELEPIKKGGLKMVII